MKSFQISWNEAKTIRHVAQVATNGDTDLVPWHAAKFPHNVSKRGTPWLYLKVTDLQMSRIDLTLMREARQ